MGRRKHHPERKDLQIHRRTAPGAAPGVVVPDPQARTSLAQIIAYGPDGYVEEPFREMSQVRELLSKFPVVWINVDGLGDGPLIERIGECFHLHRLALEDVVNTHQRAKVDVYGETLFIVARMADAQRRTNTEQLSMFLARNFVLTFQEEAGDCWNQIRARIRQGLGRLRTAGADYLAYALLDSVIDAYFPLMEAIGEELDQMEDEAIRGGRQIMERMHKVHGELLLLRRAIRPHREVFAELARDSTPIITEQTKLFLRDCYDHVIQINDLADTYREVTTDLRDLYMSSLAIRTNEIMRVLTVIATIFMPLTFIAGIYGMNFDFMPEIHWKYGYVFALVMMILTAAVMVGFFYYRRWIFVKDFDADSK